LTLHSPGCCFYLVIPAKAGIQPVVYELDSGLRRNDEDVGNDADIAAIADIEKGLHCAAPFL